ncbi:MAG: sugar transferase [Bacilli bacterium]|nr:sugar transferase [Bacilli bacterium]
MKFGFSKSQKFYLGVKRVIDFVCALFLIIVLLIPMAIVAIITKATSKGSAIFKQPRLGINKTIFMMRKFRSMRADAPQVATRQLAPEEAAKYVTKWGKFMRATSIDEIPQLFSILSGKMSFIGPRPSQDYEHEAVLVDARDSFDPTAYMVKPGLSGLAQVKLHRDHNPMHKAKLDSEYVRKLSFHQDLWIFFASFGVIFNREKRKPKVLEDANKSE